MTDQTTLIDPTSQYPRPPFEVQEQDGPGLTSDMTPAPDHGEQSYRGSGRLAGRKALITGADSGIGRAVAIAYAREGADVVLSYLPEEQADADEVVALVEQAGRTAVAMPGDVKDEQYCRELVRATVEQLGGIDVLVCNAGKQQNVDAIADLTSEQFDETMRTNVYATFYLSKAALEHMPAGGAIIISTSIQAYQPSPGLLDYAPTKAAVNTFAKGLAMQVAPRGIRVNAVAPGPIWTPLQPAGGQPPEALEDFGGQTALGRPGQPAELAPAYVFLASAESSYVVGETLSVNGGMPTP